MEGSMTTAQEAPEIDVEGISDEELDQALASAEQGDLEGNQDQVDVTETEEEGNPEAVDSESKPVTLEALAKQVEGLEKVKDRQGTELGEARKLIEQQAQLIEQLKAADSKEGDQKEEFDYANPEQSVRQTVQRTLQEQQALQQQQVLLAEKAKRDKLQALENYFPDYQEMMDDAVEHVKTNILGDRIPNVDQHLEVFRKNFHAEPIESLISIFSAAKKERELKDLKQKLAEKGTSTMSLLDKVNKQAGRRLVGDGASGKQKKALSLTDQQIANLSDEELDRALKEGL